MTNVNMLEHLNCKWYNCFRFDNYPEDQSL